MYRFALIGCGKIAERHALYISAKGSLVAVCDIDKGKADRLADKYKCASYTSLEDLLLHENIDVISVCTPNGNHAEHVIKSLQAGIHVLCEKPLCLTTAAAWQIMETAKFSRKKVFVVKSARFNPLLKQLHELIKNNLLGRIYSFQLNCFWSRPASYYSDWHGKDFPDGGTLYTQFSHYIDALIWLFGEAAEVKGYRANLAHKNVMEFEDTGAASLVMKDGALGGISWSVNSFQKNAEISLTIIAEKGTISLGGEYLNEIRYQQSDSIKITETVSIPNEYADYKGSMTHHNEIYENLIDTLDEKNTVYTGAYEGMQTVNLIEMIYKACL
jgi:UDP-N-acetyl-2-amino-2-deoxyglucuronate dehydrogenase